MPQPQKRNVGPPYRLAKNPIVDLEQEDIRDERGNRIDEDYIRRAVDRVHATVGRPSMNAAGGRASQVGVRLPDALRAAVEARARSEGTTVSAITREALERFLEA